MGRVLKEYVEYVKTLLTELLCPGISLYLLEAMTE